MSWHTDVTFVRRPPLGSVLNAVVIPPAGGDTMWTNQVAAYARPQRHPRPVPRRPDRRPRRTRPVLRLLERRDTDVEWDGAVYDTLEPVVHPVVRTHPETGERALFVNAGFTSHIIELERAESDALLAYLYEHSTRPEYTVRYHWTQATSPSGTTGPPSTPSSATSALNTGSSNG